MILVTWYSALPVQLGVSSTSWGLRTEKHNNKIKASSGNILYRRQVRNRGKFPTKCIEILSSFSKWLDWSLWLLLIFKSFNLVGYKLLMKLQNIVQPFLSPYNFLVSSTIVFFKYAFWLFIFVEFIEDCEVSAVLIPGLSDSNMNKEIHKD